MAISASSVVAGTRMPLVQRTWSKPGLARTASIHRREAVATVGVRGLE